MERVRIATFNLENLDDKPGSKPTLDQRIAVMRPQFTRIDADVLCLQEVNGQETPGQPRQLLALQKLIKGTRYETGYNIYHTALANGTEPYDVRNLVVVSRFPGVGKPVQIRDVDSEQPSYRPVTALPRPAEAKVTGWERPIFHVPLQLPGSRTLHVLVLHLKSKIPDDIAGQKVDTYTWKSSAACAEGQFISAMKRMAQACGVRREIDDLFDKVALGAPDPLIAVCGDFNCDLDEVPLVAIRGQVEETGNPDLTNRVMVPCELSITPDSRYSLLNLGKGEMLDHIIVSRPLLQYYRFTEIHNEALPDESGAFRTDVKFPESDHAPVVAEFEL